jgi:hypothetical protein
MWFALEILSIIAIRIREFFLAFAMLQEIFELTVILRASKVNVDA